MLLSYIVQELDAELDRLFRLRTLVVSLESTLVLSPLPLPVAPERTATRASAEPLATKPAAEPADQPADAREAAPAEASAAEAVLAEPGPAPSRRASRQRSPRQAVRPPQPRALTGLGAPPPTHVVVVSAEQLRRERAERVVTHTSPASGAASSTAPEQAPESLARSLAARWLGGNGSSATT